MEIAVPVELMSPLSLRKRKNFVADHQDSPVGGNGFNTQTTTLRHGANVGWTP